MSNWRKWSSRDTRKSFSGFQLKESGQVIPGDPKAVAAQQGWTPDNFGWYRDKTGKVVARSIAGKLMTVNQDEQPGGTTPVGTLDTGNPSGASGMEPADRARSLGLQSNGKGGYMDDSGNVVARTVNNELVFYDNGATGGVVSDGGGGMALSQSQPSWVDPDTGLIMVPPAQPETPSELAAVPDPTPATPPMGFDNFIKQRHLQVKGEKAEARQEAQRLDSIYGSNQNLGILRSKLEEKAAKAEESGDEYKMDIADRVRNMIGSNAEQYKEYFDTIPEDKHEELLDKVVKYTILRAKQDWYQESGLGDQFMDALKSGDLEKANFIRSKNKSPYAPERDINNMMDEANGFETVDTNDRLYKQKIGYTAGYFVGYNINERTPGSGLLSNGIDSDQEADLYNKVEEKLREYKLKPGDKMPYFDVSWGLRDDVPEETDPRKIALDALSTWKQEVLPKLKPGTVLHNYPTGGGRYKDTPDGEDQTSQRERLYKMMGFGSFNESHQAMYAVVVPGEDGKPKLEPIEIEEQPVEEVEESISHKKELSLNFLGETKVNDLSEETINILYETLGL